MTKQFRFSPEQPQWESTFKKKNEIDAIEFGQGSCTYLFYFRIYIKRSLLEKGSLVRNNPRRACVKQHTHTHSCPVCYIMSDEHFRWTGRNTADSRFPFVGERRIQEYKRKQTHLKEPFGHQLCQLAVAPRIASNHFRFFSFNSRPWKIEWPFPCDWKIEICRFSIPTSLELVGKSSTP
jgi:hypothetical protein